MTPQTLNHLSIARRVHRARTAAAHSTEAGPLTDMRTALACELGGAGSTPVSVLALGFDAFADTITGLGTSAAETVLGEALTGERRESLEIFTKVYWPTGPGGPNDSGLSRKHILESINGSLRRLKTDYVDLYQAHRFDTETPLEEIGRAHV